mmetsp:Transcript_12728/g.35823  ORF Transcript_12728/g.35823 Transcript_12728/m.35823 type:complete len:279 (-) Transcript_12728:720-1556(-)
MFRCLRFVSTSRASSRKSFRMSTILFTVSCRSPRNCIRRSTNSSAVNVLSSSSLNSSLKMKSVRSRRPNRSTPISLKVCGIDPPPLSASANIIIKLSLDSMPPSHPTLTMSADTFSATSDRFRYCLSSVPVWLTTSHNTPMSMFCTAIPVSIQHMSSTIRTILLFWRSSHVMYFRLSMKVAYSNNEYMHLGTLSKCFCCTALSSIVCFIRIAKMYITMTSRESVTRTERIAANKPFNWINNSGIARNKRPIRNIRLNRRRRAIRRSAELPRGFPPDLS